VCVWEENGVWRTIFARTGKNSRFFYNHLGLLACEICPCIIPCIVRLTLFALSVCLLLQDLVQSCLRVLPVQKNL
jgi:hypothetical protein